MGQDLTYQDMSTVSLRVGALYVLGGFDGQGVQNIVTALESTRSILQSLTADARSFIKKMLDDGLISPTEKRQLKKELALIDTEYAILIQKALDAGLPEDDAAITGYQAAYNDLHNYLYNELFLFDDMAEFTEIPDKAEFLAHFTTYYSARDNLMRATIDGLILEVKEYADSLDDATNQRIDDVRLGDVIDGAIDRSKLESGLLDEITKTGSALFPNGFDRENKIEFLEPRSVITGDMIEHILELINDSEEQLIFTGREIQLVSSKVDADRTRIASIEMNVSSITNTVAELIPLQDAQIANLSQIQQTADAINLLVTTGQYNSESGLVDSFSLAQAKLTKDAFDLFVQGEGDDWDNANWIVKHDEIVATVQNIIETDMGINATISQMIQNSEGISMTVQDLRSEAIERIDSALIDAQAGILVTSNMIQAGVQDLERNMQTLLKMQADRITALAQDVDRNTAAALTLKTDQIAALVKSGESEAYMSLSVTLPAIVNETVRGRIIKAVDKAAFDKVYTLTTSGFYYIRDDAPTSDVKALKTALRTAGFLGSQIALDADEILMGGKIYAKHLDIESINAAQAIVVGLSQVTGPDGLTVIEGGKIRTSLIETDVILGKDAVFSGTLNGAEGTFSGTLNASKGLFSGSIESGPLELSISPPVDADFATTGETIVQLIDSITAAGIKAGLYYCEGTYNGQDVGSVAWAKADTDPVTESLTTIYYVNEWMISNYDWYQYTAQWSGARSRSQYTLTVYNKDGITIASHTDIITTSDTVWTLVSKTQTGFGRSSTKKTPTYTKPTTQIPAQIPDEYCKAGLLSFISASFTMRLKKLPEYSPLLKTGDVYVDRNGRGDYSLNVKA